MSMFGIGDMMKQFGKLQVKMEEMGQKLAATEVFGESGGGMVRVVMNGRNDILSVAIEPSILRPENAVMVQDLIKAAMSQARENAKEAQSAALSEMTGGLPIPGLSLPY